MSNLAKKRVLVTGATGLIGSHLVKKLLAEKAHVIAMGRSEEKMKLVFENELNSECFSYILGNVTDKIPCELGYLDYIFHAASPISGVEIKSKPVDTILTNLNGTRNCLEYLKAQSTGRMIIFSSATVYGNQFTENITVAESKTDKADALHTANTPYSESKRMIEVLARAYCTQYQVDAVIARIGYVYGYSNPRPNTAFYEFIGKAVNGEDIVLNNTGMGRRDNIHVNDVVEGLLLVAQEGVIGEAYNLSSNGEKGNFCAIDEMAEVIAKETNLINQGKVIKAILKPMEGERKPGVKLDNAKAKALGWKIGVSLEDGIKDTIEKFMR